MGALPVVLALVGADGASADCEVVDDFLWEQDVNAWTSLAYVAVGLVLLGAVVRGRLPRVVTWLAVATVAEGVGSVLYHGRAGDASQAVHDLALIAMLGFLGGWHLGRTVRAEARGAWIGTLVATIGGGATWVLWDGATNVLAGIGVGAVLVGEVVARRRGLQATWRVPLLGITALALLAWFAGRADSPLCQPDSLAQWHGAWHVLTAVLVLVWVDAAVAAADPAHAPRLWRRGTDRVIGLLARVLVRAFHRSVEVTHRERIPADRPVLLVVNHGNGFVDPIVVAAVLGRLPRFLAKAALWKVLPARPFLALAGVLPVYRSRDGDRTENNRRTFDACHRELALGATVAIFPEGTTGDRAGLDRVKSGAARIALGGLATAPDLAIVPIGLAFESRIETRSRAVVMVGEPIPVGAWTVEHGHGDAAARGDDDHAAVHDLTEAITTSLLDVSPEFATVDERELLRGAAGVATTADDPRHRASFGRSEVVARRLATASDDARQRVIERYRAYATRLYRLGLTDRDVRPDPLPWGQLAAAVLALVLVSGPILTVSLVHLPAVALTVLLTGMVRSTATKGTVRLLVGLVTGLTTWLVVGAVLADGVAALLWAAATAAAGGIVLAVWSTVWRAAHVVVGQARARDRRGLLPAALADREAVVDAVHAATVSSRPLASPSSAPPDA